MRLQLLPEDVHPLHCQASVWSQLQEQASACVGGRLPVACVSCLYGHSRHVPSFGGHCMARSVCIDAAEMHRSAPRGGAQVHMTYVRSCITRTARWVARASRRLPGWWWIGSRCELHSCMNLGNGTGCTLGHVGWSSACRGPMYAQLLWCVRMCLCACVFGSQCPRAHDAMSLCELRYARSTLHESRMSPCV
jgi:hypothetical protein